MRNIYRLIGVALALVLSVLVVPSVEAVPGQPLRIYGSVTAPVPGTAVIVTMPNVSCPKAVAASNGEYVVNVPADDPDTQLKEGAVAGDLVSVFVDPAEPSSILFTSGGGFEQLHIVASTSQFLAIDLSVTSIGLTFTVSGTVKDGGSSDPVTGAAVVVAWGDDTPCGKTTSAAVTGGFSLVHSYATAGQFTVTTFAHKTGAAAALISNTATVTPTATTTPTATAAPTGTAAPTAVAPAPGPIAPPPSGGPGPIPTPTPTPTPTPPPLPTPCMDRTHGGRVFGDMVDTFEYVRHRA